MGRFSKSFLGVLTIPLGGFVHQVMSGKLVWLSVQGKAVDALIAHIKRLAPQLRFLFTSRY
jgi:hypothetical protein